MFFDGARKFGLLLVAGALAALAIVPTAAASPLVRWYPYQFPKPPSLATCEAKAQLACYGPRQLETAYNMRALYKKGLTGKGETIVIVDSFGSPTVKSDLKTFDKTFGLPAPPSFRVIHPAGKPPKYNPKSLVVVGWAAETSLDVQYSHAMAPGANILLVETPVAETEGVHGFPQIVKAEDYVVNHHLGHVITQSFGAAEETFPSNKSMLGLRGAYKNAAKHDVTVLAASGDYGPTDVFKNGNCCYTHRVIQWPSSDPLVTSVGGTRLHLNASGQRIEPDSAWNDTFTYFQPTAGGGGVSSVFARPSYQNSVRSIVGSMRGTPDVSMSAAGTGGVWTYRGFTGVRTPKKGWYITYGTSEASPLFAGVVAIADQIAGHGLGLINPTLYKLGDGKGSGITDIFAGNTTVYFTLHGKQHVVDGYSAGSGYDMASGLGTANGDVLVYQLAGKKP